MNHFAVPFKPKKENNNNTVTVIPKSHTQAIAEASAKNTTLSLTIAPAEHDRDCCQVGGKLPVTVTEKVHQAFTTGHGICLVTTLLNYCHGINLAKFKTVRKVPSDLPRNLAGGIQKHGLVPLQSIYSQIM